MIKIVGARGNIKDVDDFLKQIVNFAREHRVIIQVFDADVVYGKNHLISATEHAVRAFERKTNTTNSLVMEILLYASGERQLKLAISKMGIRTGKGNIAFVFIGNIKDAEGKISDHLIDELLELVSLKRNDKVLEGNEETLRKFGISENEINTVTKAKYGDLILEKVAMVDIIK
jgi:KEOPS complex subunit Cgi121